MDVKVSAVVSALVALGFKTAASWNGAKLANKLGKIKDLVGAADLNKIPQVDRTTIENAITAMESGITIQLVDDSQAAPVAPEKPVPVDAGVPHTGGETIPQPTDVAGDKEKTVAAKKTAKGGKAPAKTAPAKKGKTPPAPAPEVTPEPEPAPAPAKAAKKAKTPPAPAPAPEPEVAGPAGVRSMTTSRPYIAGQVIAKAGIDAGITDAMGHEVDVAFGKENHRESMFCLRNAWHAIRGYQGLE